MRFSNQVLVDWHNLLKRAMSEHVKILSAQDANRMYDRLVPRQTAVLISLYMFEEVVAVDSIEQGSLDVATGMIDALRSLIARARAAIRVAKLMQRTTART